ncbi:MAG: ferrous iron transport protein B [Hydrogenobacter thermophilus]|uniref:ferrous iron transport protein B n=1 Tax=Hydrogenobacter thermophilus TaxID=940 RepID=UPI001C775DDE|nr:ferrous iron transport protein B [Hydrogenobacter thermophilus]QWK20258.1 MAG: ferrous iron transport protein B [Hydrogenobacter thermophilus]
MKVLKKILRVALAGNPNVGKTSILNHLAGTTLKVGNWPGVTVEKREGKATYKDYTLILVDLPGIYTLEPVSEDELIAYRFLTEESPDVIVNVIETPNMERDLLLTAELLELGLPMVIVLNMMDEAQKLGIEIDTQKLEELLGIKVVKTNGRIGLGVKEILSAVIETYEKGIKPKEVKYSEEMEKILDALREEASESKHQLIKKLLSYREHAQKLERFYGKPVYDILRDDRFAFVHGLYNEVVKRKAITSMDITSLLDKFLLHPYLGMTIFLLVMFALFKVSFDFSKPFMDWLDGFLNGFVSPFVRIELEKLGVENWVVRFISEALIGGVGFVLTFTPLIATIYLLLSFLEFTGYLPRIAFLMDRFMHRLGLHGKSLIPLLLGFGCNVPAIVATRTMESRRDKLLVIAMIPFMSCPARLVVFSFFAITFFSHPVLVIFSLYLLGILVAFFTAILLKKVAFKGGLDHFVMELPPYRLPTLRLLLRIVWVYLKDFLYRAGTLIFAVSVLIWLSLNLPPGVKTTQESLAGRFGKLITPIFEPIGITDWRISTSLIPAFLAREIVLSSMATIYSVEKEETKDFLPLEEVKKQAYALKDAAEEAFSSLINPLPKTFEVSEEHNTLRAAISKSMSGASALSFMIFILIYTSCLGTVAVMWREAGRGFALGFLIYSFVMAWIVSFLVYRIGSLI